MKITMSKNARAAILAVVFVAFGIGSKAQVMARTGETIAPAIESRFHRELVEHFISHIEQAKRVDIPYYADEFPWRIDWDKQQRFCQDIWQSLKKNREQLFLFLNTPIASASKNGEEKFQEKWREIGLLRGFHTHVGPRESSLNEKPDEREIFRDRTHWVLVTQYHQDAKVGSESPTMSARITFKTEPYTWGASTEKYLSSERRYERQPKPSNFPFAIGGIEQVFAIVNGNLLRIRYGRYTQTFDQRHQVLHTDATPVVWPGYEELFGRRKGRFGQGFVAIDSHEVSLYRSLAAEKTGYVEAGTGVIPDGDGPTLESPWVSDYQTPVCVINFDLN